MRIALISAVLAGCSEYEISPKETSPSVIPGTTGTVAPPVCDDPMPATYAPVLEAACEGEPVIGAFDPVTEWQWRDNAYNPGYEQIMATPAVAPLVAGGDPVIVFTAFAYFASYAGPGALVAVNGDGSTLWSTLDVGGYQPYSSSGVAIADLGDGRGPAILLTSTVGLLAVNGDGSLRWNAVIPISPYGAPAIGDVEGDGVAEIAYGPSLLSADGTVRWTGAGGSGGYMSFFADVDADGTSEIVAGNTVYAADGSIRASDGGADGYPAIADLQGDGSPEIIVVGGGAVRAWDPATGGVVWTAPLAAGGGGAPTVADLDGDGLPEIGTANSTYYQAFDGDGVEMWRNAIQDYSSSITSSAVFDFEGDGAAEIVYADEETLWVFDGGTGAVEMAWSSHSSGTLFEYPVIVDIDADGSAEILVASNDYTIAGSRGITAVGDANGTWAPARTVWNQHAYHVTNVADDGTIPAGGPGSWTSWNSFRAGNSETATGLALPDLALGEPQICLTTCDGAVSLWVPVENQASRDLVGVDVVVLDGAGAEVARGAVDVGAGETAWAGPFDVATSAWAAGAVSIVADPDGAVVECDEADSRREIATSPCG